MVLVILALGCFGLLTSTVFAGMVMAGGRHHWCEKTAAGRRYAPALTLLKPVHGDEAGLEAHLATFFEQDYPVYEILFCARDEADKGLAVARRVAAKYPQVAARFFWTGDAPYINAKVRSLEVMAAEARYDIYVISDSDVRVTREYLREVAAPFQDAKVGGMTCLYRGVAAEGGLWARLEAVGMSVEMTGGVLVANMLEGMQFVLGPTMAFRRAAVEQMGGFRVTAEYCADDFVLGNEAYRLGWKVALSHHGIDHMVLNSTFWASMKHQVRWMKSTRFSRPKGHFGTSLTFAMPFALLVLGACWAMGRPWLGALLFGWGLLTRWAIAWAAGWRTVGERSWFELGVLYPLRDLMGFGFWAASYTSSRILWRGRVFELLPGGKMRAAE
jgi:ceramide glucosyltransferase